MTKLKKVELIELIEHPGLGIGGVGYSELCLSFSDGHYCTLLFCEGDDIDSITAGLRKFAGAVEMISTL